MQRDNMGNSFEKMLETLFGYVEDDQGITVGTFGRANRANEAIAYFAIDCPDMKTIKEKTKLLQFLCSDATPKNSIKNVFSYNSYLEGRTKGLSFAIERGSNNITVRYQSKYEVNGKPGLYSESNVPMNEETYQDFKEKIEGNGGLVLVLSLKKDIIPLVYLTIDEITFEEKI